MSIEKATGQGSSITELSQALTYFTDRHSLVWLFAQCLNADNPREDILFLYGDGGNGKTLLLDFLRTKCTKYFCARVWKNLQVLGEAGSLSEVADEIVQARVPQECLPIPTAHLDFGLRQSGGNFLDPFYGLLKLRRDLAQPITQGYPLRFPLYDFACLWYLHKTGELTQEKVKKLFPADEVSFLLGIADLIQQTPAINLISTFMTFCNSSLSGWYTFYKAKRGLEERHIHDIQTWDPERKLIYELPRLFAEDLNAGMTKEDAPKRVVLFFDTHEAFWGVHERTLTEDLYFAKDEWLRQLLVKLNLESGIVVVVAGREVPPWEKATDNHFPIPKKYINQQLVKHFTPADAESYLQRIRKNPNEHEALRHNLDDSALRQSLIAVASDQKGLVHPFYLGLCVDVVRAANRRGESLTAQDFADAKQATDKTRELMNRLLKYIDEDTRDAVHALSACRAFDEALYFKLGEALNFHATSASFRVLTRYSFVWQTGQQGMYRMHDLIRRSDDEKLTRLRAQTNEDQTSKAWIEQRIHTHGVLEHYYQEREETPELIYHANRQDWDRGVTEWINVFGMALQSSRYDLCRSLLSVRTELIISKNTKTGLILHQEGDFLAVIARYEEAKKKYLEAITAHDEAILLDLDYVRAHHTNKGVTLSKLGDLQSTLSNHKEAIKNYKDAIESYSSVLRITPNHVGAHNNIGYTLLRLGDLQSKLSQHQEAIKSYKGAIGSCSEALRIAPDKVDPHNNKGIALSSLGDLQSKLSQHQEAIESYQGAIGSYSEALRIAPDDVNTHTNRGNTLSSLGDLQSKLSQYKEAMESYQGAIKSYSEALRVAPDGVSSHTNKGGTLSKLGDLQSKLSQHQEAIESYQGAIGSCSEALQIAPDHVGAHTNKGNTLSSLGDLQSKLSQHQEAIESYQGAIGSCSEALRIAPDEVAAHINKGKALSSLGDLQSKSSQHQEAIKSYQGAIESCSNALLIAPDDVIAQNNKGITQSKLGDLQSNSFQYREAIKNYQGAIDSCSKVLRVAPDDVIAQNNKGITQSKLGDLQLNSFQYQEAIKNYQGAIDSCSEALRVAPDDVLAPNNKWKILFFLCAIRLKLSQTEKARRNWQEALVEFDHSLQIASDNL